MAPLIVFFWFCNFGSATMARVAVTIGRIKEQIYNSSATLALVSLKILWIPQSSPRLPTMRYAAGRATYSHLEHVARQANDNVESVMPSAAKFIVAVSLTRAAARKPRHRPAGWSQLALRATSGSPPLVGDDTVWLAACNT